MIHLAAIVAVAAAAGAAPEVTVTARVSDDVVTLGDRFQVTVAVVHPTGMAVNVPASLDLGTAFAELDRSAVEEDHGDGTSTRRFAIELAAYDVGELEIPAIPVTYVADGAAHSVQTPALPVVVESYIGQRDAGLAPLAGPVAVERRDWMLAYIGLALVGAGMLVGLGVLVSRRMRGRERAAAVARAAVERRLPPHEEALARLQKLEASGALDAEDLKPAYFEMSEILRDYLGRRFGFPGIDYTTEEVNDAMAARSEAQVIAGDVSLWLADADFVKFADYPASPDEARGALYKTRHFVNETLPRPPQEARRA